jgi:putative intracellular protease/amidase
MFQDGCGLCGEGRHVGIEYMIVSTDRFEDSELSEPLQQLQAKEVEVDIAALQQGPITGKHGHRVSASLALSAVRTEDFDLLLLPGGEAPASLRKIPEAAAIAQHFLQADYPLFYEPLGLDWGRWPCLCKKFPRNRNRWG